MSASSDPMQPDGSGDDALRFDVAHSERRAAQDLVASEISHEIAHTLNFLRVLVADAEEGVVLSAEDIAIARRETERLAQLMTHLRQLKLSLPAPAVVALHEVLRRAEAEVDASAVGVQLSISSALDANVMLLTAPSLLYILLLYWSTTPSTSGTQETQTTSASDFQQRVALPRIRLAARSRER